MKIKLVGFVSLLLVLSIGLAEVNISSNTTNGLNSNPSNIPAGCGNKGYRFQNGQLILGKQNNLYNQQIYLIHNSSDFDQLLLSHPTNTAMAAGWDSRLDRGQWSALAMNQTGFILKCFGRKRGAIGYVNCQTVLTVCSYPTAQLSGEGSYWLAENKTLSELINTLRMSNVALPK